MNISKNLMININMRPIPLCTILFLFLKYTQKRMEKFFQIPINKTMDNLKQILQIDLPLQTRGDVKNSFLNTSSTIIRNN